MQTVRHNAQFQKNLKQWPKVNLAKVLTTLYHDHENALVLLARSIPGNPATI